MQAHGAYLFLDENDAIADTPDYTEALAAALALPAPVGDYYPSSGTALASTSTPVELPTLDRLDLDAEVPAVLMPYNSELLCMLTMSCSVQVHSTSTADYTRIYPAVRSGFSAFGDPSYGSHTSTYQSLVVYAESSSDNGRYQQASRTWLVQLSRHASVRMFYESPGHTCRVSYSKIDLLPLRWVIP